LSTPLDSNRKILMELTEPEGTDARLSASARALWKYWWPSIEPMDNESYKKWWEICFTEARIVIDALDSLEDGVK